MADSQWCFENPYDAADHINSLESRLAAYEQRERVLRSALQLARDMFVANDMDLPHTFEVIDEALAAADHIPDVIPVSELLTIIPGTYYMDPPDGGSVTVMAQLKRMVVDAERYRWLRQQIVSGPLTVAKVGTWDMESWSGDDPDKAIDKARKGGE